MLFPRLFKLDHYRSIDLFWLGVFTFSFLAIGVGLRDPWPADEPRFALIAKTMVDSGQWLFPMRGGELYPDKPPLFMWSIALLYALTGSLKIAFLIPSAIAGTVTTIAVFDITRRLYNSRVAWYAVGLLLSSIQFVLQAKAAQIDASVCMWVTLGCYGLLRAVLTPNALRWWYLGCVCMGLGIMTKGVGFLPILMLIPYGIMRWRASSNVAVGVNPYSGWTWIVGVGVMLLTLLVWLLPMILAVAGSDNPDYQAYRDNIMLKQTVTRYANPWHHIKPFWYFVTSVIPWAWLPIVLLLPGLLPAWRSAWKQGDSRVILPLGFTLLVLVFFSLSPGKRGVYILPALPMLVVACAPYIGAIAQKAWSSKITWGISILLSTLLVLMGILSFAEVKPMVALMTRHDINPSLFFIITGLTLVVGLLMVRRQHGFVAWAVFVGIFWLFYSTWFAVLLNPVRTPKVIWENISATVPPVGEVALIGTGEQFMLFSQRDVVHFGYHTPEDVQLMAAWQWVQERQDRFVLVPASLNNPCFNRETAKDVGYAHRTHWLLLTADNAKATCETPTWPVTQYHFTLTP